MLPWQAPKLQCDIIRIINTFCMLAKDFNQDTMVAVSFSERCLCGIKGCMWLRTLKPFHEQIHNLRFLLSFFCWPVHKSNHFIFHKPRAPKIQWFLDILQWDLYSTQNTFAIENQTGVKAEMTWSQFTDKILTLGTKKCLYFLRFRFI